jgi:hypothetical protein
MSVGLPVTKDEIDSRAGDTARSFQKAFEDTITMQSYLTQTADADLVTLGYTEAEVSTLKSAFSDLAQLGQIFAGSAGLAAPKDFRTFVRQVWGVGAF